MSIEDVGFWIAPNKERIDAYQSQEKTHEGVAARILNQQPDGTATDNLLKQGWIRISMGTVINVFQLDRKKWSILKEFLEERHEIYENTVLEVQTNKETRMISMEDFLKDS